MKTYTGTITKEPIVKDSIIISAIKTTETDKPMQIVLFPKHRPHINQSILTNLNIGDDITLLGKIERNPRTNEKQIIIDEIQDAANPNPLDAYSISETDFQVGASTNHGIISIQGNPLKERLYFTDGHMYWYEDSTVKTPLVY